MKELDINNNVFEDIKHIDEEGKEYWLARELMPLLEYNKWENFHKVIKVAMIACKISGKEIGEHFPDVRKVLKVGNNAKMQVLDYKLSRYACYLIEQNGDSHMEVIALAQTYFVVKTRKMELLEQDYNLLTEDEKRFYLGNLTKKGNLALNRTAKKVDVKNFKKKIFN